MKIEHRLALENGTYGYDDAVDNAMLELLRALSHSTHDDRQAHVTEWRQRHGFTTPMQWQFVAWLLCRIDAIEYGGSPRYPWLSENGKTLLAALEKHGVDADGWPQIWMEPTL